MYKKQTIYKRIYCEKSVMAKVINYQWFCDFYAYMTLVEEWQKFIEITLSLVFSVSIYSLDNVKIIFKINYENQLDTIQLVY